MILKRPKPKCIDYSKWHKWFAWKAVKLLGPEVNREFPGSSSDLEFSEENPDCIVWLEWVERIRPKRSGPFFYRSIPKTKLQKQLNNLITDKKELDKICQL